MKDLLVPYAISASLGDEVFPEKAMPGGQYLCPECNKPVGIRIPEKRRAHFFHIPPLGSCALNPANGAKGEGHQHALAKHFLYAWLKKWLSGETTIAPAIEGKCSTHSRSFAIEIPKPSPYQVEKEYRIPSGRRLDVAVLNEDGRVSMGFEVFHSNHVGEEKGAELPARWIELRAKSIISSYSQLLEGLAPEPLLALRWARYDDPPCCKNHKRFVPAPPTQVRIPVSSSYQPETVVIPPPTVEMSEDSDLLAASGVACREGISPREFAKQYGKKIGASEHWVLQRLLTYGIAKGDWRW